MSNYNFGVFYTCYTEYESVEYSLEMLYKYYPDIPVYLVSDGGKSYKDLEDKFSNLKTKLSEDSRGFIPSLNKENFISDDNQKKIKESIKIFLTRIKDSIEYCKNPKYMLVMEPDVLLRGKIQINENAHLLGTRVNYGLNDELRKAIRSIPGSIDVNCWGATPAIFKTETFLKCCEWIDNNEEKFDNLLKLDFRISFYDVLFSVIFAILGYEEVLNSEVTECYRDPNWLYSHHPLLHQFRAKYPTSKNGYDGTHTKHIHGLGDYWPWER